MTGSLQSSGRLLTIAALILVVVLSSSRLAFAVTPGTKYPSQKITFTDPLTGRVVWRMTTDGATLGAIHGAAGDQSSESRSWSPDSTKIVYSKYNHDPAIKPVGVYMMDTLTGVETFLAPSVWYAQPIFARNGSGEVYYYDRSGGNLVVRAVSTQSYAVRTIVTLGGATWQEKLEVNANGSYLSAHPQISGSYRTVIVTPQGAIHANWGLSGPASDDGAVWHPTDPKRIVAARNGQYRIWHIDTLASTPATLAPDHASLHPNGLWHLTQGYLTNIETGASVMSGGGMYPYHPNINPAQASLGLDAQVAVDDRKWDSIPGRPRLYLPTIRRLLSISNAIWASDDSSLAAVHYSSLARNYAHVHAHWSWDGRYVLWTSDLSDLRDGTPPGGTGSGDRTDLFILPMDTQPLPTTPVLSVSPTSLSFTAAQGGGVPPLQSLTIDNTGGGTLTWTASDNAAWLSGSATSGVGDATLNVTASPVGLAAGTYTGTITVSASGASGSPKSVAVTLTVTPQAPALSVTPSSLSFTAVQGGTAPVAQSLTISNTGGGTLTWTVSDNAAWLSTSLAAGAGNATVSVSVNPTGLATGTYTATITATASGATGSPKTIGVTLTVAAASVRVTFDNPAPPGSSGSTLSGVFQGINFGTNKWRWEGPFNVDRTNHIYFDSSQGTSRTFSFGTSPKILARMTVFSTSSGTLTLTDDLGQRKVQAITTGSMPLVTTGWTRPSTTVTVSFTSGWDLGVDDIEYRSP